MIDHFIYVSQSGAIALRAMGDRLQVIGRFDASADRVVGAGVQPAAAFEQHLQRYAGDRFCVLVDTPEEEMLVDDLPPLNARDRNALINKRLALRHRDLRFKTWRPYAFTGDPPRGVQRLLGRRASSVLIAVLRGEAALTPWIQAIESSKVCLESLHSTALLAPLLLGAACKGRTGLLVSMQPGGLRQTLIVDGAIRFSRLAVTRQPLDVAGLLSETENTIQYLLMSQIIHRERLRGDFEIWALPGGFPELGSQRVQLVEGSEPAQFKLVNDGLKKLLLEDAESNSDLASLPLWCAGLRERRSGIGYATRAQRVHASAALAQRAVRAVTLTAVSACLCIAVGLEGYRVFRSTSVSTLKKYEYLIGEKQAELEQMKGELGVSGTELNQITRAADGLRRREIPAGTLLQVVSEVIADESELRVYRLAWQRAGADAGSALPTMALTPGGPPVAGMTPGSPGGIGGAVPAVAGPAAGSTIMPGVSPGNAPGMAAGAAAEGLDQRAPDLASQMASDVILEIDGKVPLRIGKSAGNQKVQMLRDRLSGRCQCEVQVSRWPHDNKPSSTLSGDFQAERSTAQVAFEIRLRLSPAQGKRVLTVSSSPAAPDMGGHRALASVAER